MKALYINPYTDFGFKKLFGEEANKNLLVDFLNQLLPSEHKISDLSFKNSEKLGCGTADRKAIFDIYCQNEKGERFIVEMQKAKLNFFKDRTLFYSSFPIREQAEKGDWNFKLTPVYCVAILDFEFDEDRKQADFVTNVQLKDQFCRVFYNRLTYIFIEMPRFNKTEDELSSHFDKWLYFLKNLESFDHIPNILKEDVFIQGFETARIANFNLQEMDAYEESLKVYRDLKGVIDTAFQDGKVEGKIEGKIEGIIEGKIEGEKAKADEIALRMKKRGDTIQDIIELTGLTEEEILKL